MASLSSLPGNRFDAGLGLPVAAASAFSAALSSPPFVSAPLAASVTDALGRVPIVRLNRLHPTCHNHDLYLKLESCNPGGSIKEKNAAYLVHQAEQSGQLRPGERS
ncbi:pyridoxal-phosphate dependent enzyme [Alkalinema pantanalense CENA528]|uniref:pyridoxal-phosphate dependent enzyme n=1 Tax=Alkalinema pantanalense TaxID=1620705 RepID=UPI003D6DF373